MNSNLEDDDLEITPPNTSTRQTSTTTTKAAPTAIDDLDVSFGDPKLMVKGDGLARFRPEKNKAIRFAFLPIEIAGKPKSAKSHFIDKKGTYRCLTKGEDLAFCCSTGLEARTHIVAPVLRYSNADPSTGKLDKDVPIKWELGYIDMSQVNYRQVCSLPDEDSDVYSIDLIMFHANRAFGYEFSRISAKARWLLDGQIKAAVGQSAKRMFLHDGGKKLASRLGKTASLLEWRNLISSAANNAEDASLSDIDELN